MESPLEIADPPPADGLIDCPNCGAAVTDKYCPACGQRTIEPHEFAIRHFLGHILHEITHLDSNKILKTFVALVTKPGLLTREYLAGRKGSYINPVRIYLTVSALYFLFAWGALATAGGGGAESNQARPYVVKLADKKGLEPSVMAAKIQEKAGKYSAVLRFASVLLSGLFLALLYRGSHKYYAEHLIFSLHFYSFDFLAKCVVAVVYLTSDQVVAARVLYYITIFIYLFFALLRVYRQPWPRTLIKAGVQFGLEVLLFIAVNIVGLIIAAVLP